MNNLIIAKNYETFGEEGLTSNKVIYYKEDNMVKFRANITDNPYGESEVVTVGGSSEVKDFDEQYLTLEALESGSITFVPTTGNDNKLSYSKDGRTWTKGNSVSVSSGEKVMFKGEGFTPVAESSGGIGTFGDNATTSPATTIRFKAYGNIMSLIHSDNFIGKQSFVGTYTFCCLFKNTNITEAHNIILPSLTLADRCYYKMFMNCAYLVSMPTLVATTISDHCYSKMFSGCTVLANNIPSILPVMTLGDNCYEGMFKDCKALIVAPKLPATTLINGCYASMFSGCSNMEVAPELPAPTLANTCYWRMLEKCPKLNFIKCLATNISATSSHASWVSGVAATGTFIKADNATSWTTGVNGIPSGWNAYTESEEMPLYQADSYDMVATFEDDTTLTTKIYVKP